KSGRSIVRLPGRARECVRLAPDAKVPLDPSKYKCRREPIPVTEWSEHACKNRPATRLACPIGCEHELKLPESPQKVPDNSPLCRDTCTYGKYRDEALGDWYLWIAAPCVANITTHCRFEDAPVHSKPKQAGVKEGKKPVSDEKKVRIR
ncbi:Protein C10F3.7, partial [Aphelenchoides avenae]